MCNEANHTGRNLKCIDVETDVKQEGLSVNVGCPQLGYGGEQRLCHIRVEPICCDKFVKYSVNGGSVRKTHSGVVFNKGIIVLEEETDLNHGRK